MRRPPPLPHPPAAPRGAAGAGLPTRPSRSGAAATTEDLSAPRRDVDDAANVDSRLLEATDAASPGDAVGSGENATGAGIPLAAPKPLPDRAPADSTISGASDEAADAADVGFRDVWQAARARRKALRAEIRRFTVRQRRRRALWLGAAASVVLLALGTVGAAYSPLFGVERISVVGAQRLAAEDIAAALAGQLGTPLPLVDESAVKAQLVAFPLIETYALEARPPHELVVRIVERTPIGLIETRAGYTLVDAAGVALSTAATPSPGTPLLTIAGGVDSDAFTAAGQVMRTLPDDIRAQVTEVTASTPDDVTLSLGGTNSQVVWGSAENSADKALNLAKMMAARPPADVVTYDVSSSDVVVVR